MMNTRLAAQFDPRRLFRRNGVDKALRCEGKPFERFLDNHMLQAKVLLAAISVADYGSGKDGNAIQAALDAAKPGDTVTLPAGTYNVSDTLQVHTGTTLTGAPNNASRVNFNLSGPTYGMTIDGGASDVTIESLNMVSSSGVIGMYYGSGYTNIHITNNALQFGGGRTSNGTLIFGIYGTVHNEGLQVTSNYFHDSPNSVRDWEIWYADNANLDYNTLYKVADGGHTCQPIANVSFSYNYGEQIRRMGQEIQGSGGGTNLQVVGNTFYDWVNPYYDSFGLSIVNHDSHGTNISRNFLSANIAQGSGWGIPDGGGAHRFGYAIEAGGLDMTVNSNTIIGDWIAGVVASRKNVSASNNAKYGPSYWGDWIGEPSLDGFGSLLLSGDSVDRNVGDAPAPPQLSDDQYKYNPKIDGTPAAELPVITPGAPTSGTPTGSTSSGGGWDSSSGGTGSNGTGGNGSGTSNPPVSQTPGAPQNTGTTPTGATAIGTPVEIDPAADTTVPVGTLGTLTVTPLSATSAKLEWTNPTLAQGKDQVSAPIISQVEVDVQSTVGKEHFASVVYSDDIVKATLVNLHSGWQIDFTVTATTSTGDLYRSGPVTAMFGGNSHASFTGPLWGGINKVRHPKDLQ